MADLLAIDTTVLIDHERGNDAAAKFVSDLLRRNVAAIHPITRAEMIYGVRDRKHLHRVRVMLEPFRVLNVKNADFAAACELLESNVLAKRVG